MKQLLLGLLILFPSFSFSQAFTTEIHPLERLAHPFENQLTHKVFEKPYKQEEMHQIEDLIGNLEQKFADLDYPGMFFTIVTPQKVLWSGAMGYADLRNERLVDEKTQFRLGSLTKGVVALGILKLVEEGHFKLDSRLVDLAPEIPFENPYAKTHPVKVHQLLEHTTGFEEMHLNALYNVTDDPDLPLIDRIYKSKASLIARWEPGTKHAYCNPGYLIAGYLIEKYSGMPYDEYLQKNILHPSGMLHSGFQNEIRSDENIATGYNLRNQQWKDSPYYSIYSSPSGAWNAGAYDLSKYLQLLLNEGKVNGKQIISKSHISRMERPEETDAVKCGLTTGYGLGMYVNYMLTSVPFMAHGGAMEGFSSHLAYNRDLGIGYALSVNGRVDLGPLIEIIIAYLEQNYIQKHPPIQPLDPVIPANYTGYYKPAALHVELLRFQEELTRGVYIFEENGTMKVKDLSSRQTPIFVVENNLFRFPNECGPTSVFCEDKGGTQVFMTGGGLSYYEKTSDRSSRYLRQALNTSLILLLTLIPVGGIWILMFLFGKIERQEMLTRFSPVLACSLLIISQILLTHILDDFLYAGILTVYTGGYYMATLCFALFSLASLGLTIRDFASFRNVLVPIYVGACSLALCFLTGFFWYYGLLGLKFWDY